MNFLHHRQKTRGHVLPMPEGLQELMGDISREVLRCQPSIDCTYKFIADYLEAMANTRDKCRIAIEVIEEAILKTDEVYSQFAKCNIPKDKTNSFLNMMELTFRRFVDQKRQRNQDPRFIKFHADDMLDELVRKCDLTKVEVLRSKPAIQWAYRKFVKTYLAAIEGTLDTEDLYLDTEKYLASSKELDEMHQSAIQIQKAFRGYQTRKSLQEKQQLQFKVHQESEDSSSSSSFRDFILGRQEEMAKAAIKIQASFKGFYVRKKNVLDKKKVSLKLYNPIMVDRRSSTTVASSFSHSQSEEPKEEQITNELTSPPVDDSSEILIQEADSLKNVQEVSHNSLRESQEILEVSNTGPQDLHEAAVQEVSNNSLRESQKILEVSNTDPQDLNEAAVQEDSHNSLRESREILEVSNTDPQDLNEAAVQEVSNNSLRESREILEVSNTDPQDLNEADVQEVSNTSLREPREILEVSNTDPQDLNEAAVKIQATFKGYRVRKEMSTKRRNSKTLQEQQSNLHPEPET